MFRKSTVMFFIVALAVNGCSLVDAPEPTAGDGAIRLYFSGAGTGGATAVGSRELQRALVAADSVRVCVYRAGSGATPEVCEGVALSPPADTVTIDLTVRAELGKRVAVELFQGGAMTFFGVDEDVDVLSGVNTDVQITATAFDTPTLGRNKALVGDGEVFRFVWTPTDMATEYRLEAGPDAGFSTVAWETTVTDTSLAATLEAGSYFFRVRSENIYTAGQWSNSHFVHVYGSPQITAISADEDMRGEVIDVSISGFDLDYNLASGATTVELFGQTVLVLSSSPLSIHGQIQIPNNALSASATVSNPWGSAVSADVVRVQNIAYIMGAFPGPPTGDPVTADDYKGIIDGFGAKTAFSTVATIPYDLIDTTDMGLFDLIVIGWETGVDEFDWGGGGAAGTARANAIQQSLAPVLGNGRGGLAYFELSGLAIGTNNASPIVQAEVYVLDPADDIFNQPNNFLVSAGDMLAIYKIPVTQWGISPSLNVTPRASQAPLTALFPLIEESVASPTPVINFLWGFHEMPRNLAPVGLDMLENVVVYLLGQGAKVPVPTN